jgi:CBS domain-containing protein
MNATVADWMTPDVVAVSPDATLWLAVATMRRRAIRHLCVVDAQGRLVGILSDRDVTRVLPGALRNRPQCRPLLQVAQVRHLMTTAPVVTVPDAALWGADIQMTNLGIGALPVVDPISGKLVGMFTRADYKMALAQGLQIAA